MESKPLTLIDTLTVPLNIQILKACIPFLPEKFQMEFCLFLKFEELKSTMKYFKESKKLQIQSTENSNKLNSILESIKCYMSEEDASNIEMIMNILSLKDTFKDMDLSNFTPEDLANISGMKGFEDILKPKGDNKDGGLEK